MNLTAGLLAQCLTIPQVRADLWAPSLALTTDRYVINTPRRLAAFLSQIGQESGRLLYVKEIWGPTSQQTAYEGRLDLGNTQPGDGRLYCGRGLIETTGRANYAKLRDSLRAQGVAGVPDFEQTPEALEITVWAALSAGEYWRMRGLNALADIGDNERITRRVTGGLEPKSFASRVAMYNIALPILQAAESEVTT